MKHNTHCIVPSRRFTLLSGADALSTYTFGTHAAKHQFCSHCGICAFYRPRSNPDGVAVTICPSKFCGTLQNIEPAACHSSDLHTHCPACSANR